MYDSEICPSLVNKYVKDESSIVLHSYNDGNQVFHIKNVDGTVSDIDKDEYKEFTNSNRGRLLEFYDFIHFKGYTDDACIFVSMEKRRFHPTNIIGNPIF